MGSLLATKNFFIDTSIFEANNFFHGRGIQSILYYSNKGFINIYTTTITTNEIIDRMKFNLISGRNEYNKYVNTINDKNLRVLKNIERYENLKALKFDLTEILLELKTKFELNMKYGKVITLESSNVNPENIFNLYFKSYPPFSEGKKKYEFPDAFVLKTLEEFCLLSRKRMYIISNDNDFNGYKSPKLIMRNNLSSMLEIITIAYDRHTKMNLIPKIETSLQRNEASILNLIEDELITKVEFVTNYEKISVPKLHSLELENYVITALQDKYAEIEYNAILNYSVNIFTTQADVTNTFFEDKVRTKVHNFEVRLSIYLEVEFDRINIFKINWRNMQPPIIIQIK
jgi:hypothetical protein